MATSDTKMTTDLELAEEIERYLAPDATYHHWDPSLEDMEQIIAALRRWPERPPSGEMVPVPRLPTYEMLLAAHKMRPFYSTDDYGVVYLAMLSAAEAEAEGRKS